MRVAILHDYLNQFGGAERVLQAILEIFPEADLYTLLYDKNKTRGLFEKNIKKTSFLDFDFIRKNHRLFIPFMPVAANFLTSPDNYDLIISSTAGYGKGINIKAPYHVSYCHTPLRYAWEINYLKDLSFSPWPLKEGIIKPIAGFLKKWDQNSSSRVNIFIANSDFIAKKINVYYGRESEVIYPPVDTTVFYREKRVSPSENYFLMAGRLLYYKGFDLGIKAFNFLGKKLKIIGSGPESKKLKKIADPRYIEFISYVPDDELRRLYSNAKALIFPQIEDFGLVAAEGQACGLPVLALSQGGAKEIVENKKTGIFFNEQSSDAIIRAVKDFEEMSFDREYIAKSALRFSKENFKERIGEIVHRAGF